MERKRHDTGVRETNASDHATEESADAARAGSRVEQALLIKKRAQRRAAHAQGTASEPEATHLRGAQEQALRHYQAKVEQEGGAAAREAGTHISTVFDYVTAGGYRLHGDRQTLTLTAPNGQQMQYQFERHPPSDAATVRAAVESVAHAVFGAQPGWTPIVYATVAITCAAVIAIATFGAFTGYSPPLIEAIEARVGTITTPTGVSEDAAGAVTTAVANASSTGQQVAGTVASAVDQGADAARKRFG